VRLELGKNLALKFSSLLLALLVWILATGEIQRIKDLTVPLQLTGLPTGMAISGQVPDRVSVRIEGPEPILQRITEDQVDARLDLSQLPAGDQVVMLSPDRFRVSGAKVIRVEPRVLPLRIVPLVEKSVPVVPRLEGKPPEGFEVVDYQVDPATVVVVGPEDSVREIRRATTGSIPVAGLTASREMRVHPVPEGESGGAVRLQDPDCTVLVRIGVRERKLARTLRNVPVRVGGGLHARRIRPNSIDVKVSGPASLVGALDRGNLLIEVDVEGLAPRDRDYRLTPQVRLVGVPAEREDELEITPASRTVAVSIESSAQEKP
jgi:YbbR domain-containing protein